MTWTTEVWNPVHLRRRHVCFKETMSSKKKRTEGRSGESLEKAEEIFQAVILSDSFNFRFLPITLETPRVSYQFCFQSHVLAKLPRPLAFQYFQFVLICLDYLIFFLASRAAVLSCHCSEMPDSGHLKSGDFFFCAHPAPPPLPKIPTCDPPPLHFSQNKPRPLKFL